MTEPFDPEKIAIVHDWMTSMRGGEKCLELFCELFPQATLFSLFHAKGKLSPVIEKMKIKLSFLQNIPGITHYYRYLLPLFPIAIESLKLPPVKIIISSSHCVAKGVIPPKGAFHLCYCFTPMRYIWDMYEVYFKKDHNFFVSKFSNLFVNYLRKWDIKSTSRVDHFVAISRYVAERIKRIYNRDADVIYPPVNTDFYQPDYSKKREDFFFTAGAFAPYKRTDLIIKAFNRLGFPLKIIGTGQEKRRLKNMAKPNIEFLGWQPDEVVRKYYQRCRAFVFAGEEEFGITLVEAQATGAPVIAFGKGGAAEIVIPINNSSQKEATGVLFYEQKESSITDAINYFIANEDKFMPDTIRKNALRFNKDRFKNEITNLIRNII